MAFTVEYRHEAVVSLRKMEKAQGQRIIEKITDAALNPGHFFQRLANSPLYKLRAGDWRVLAHLDFGASKISIVTIGHRKNEYD